MLLPQLSELLELRYQAHQIGLISTQRVYTPLSGLYASVFRGQGMNFDEVREYQQGDEIRHIDWRVTARMNKPYLKIYREERERTVMLCVDQGLHMQFGTRGTFKNVQAARVAALLGWSAQGHGDRVGGLLFGRGKPQFFRANRSQRAFLRLLRSLTLSPTDPAAEDALANALLVLNRSTATGALLFVIADFHHISVTTLQRALSQLHQRHEIVLISIDDVADYELPAIGQVRFIAPNGKQIMVNTDHTAGRMAYRQTWETQRQQIEEMAKRLYLDWFSITTQADVYQSLWAGLRQRIQKQQTHR